MTSSICCRMVINVNYIFFTSMRAKSVKNDRDASFERGEEYE